MGDALAAPLVVLSVLLLSGCSTPGSSRYNTAEVGRPVETGSGAIVSSRIVQVEGDDSKVGPFAGGALGGAGAGWGFQSGWAAVLGAVIGAGAGYLAQDALTARDGIEYVVHMDDGRTLTLVQNRQSGEPPIGNGTPVLVQLGGPYSRVFADPRGGSRQTPAPSPAAGAGSPPAATGAATAALQTAVP